MTMQIEPGARVATAPLRSPEQVMRLERLGSFHQTRLSFMRTLLRRLKRERWRFERPLWHLDGRGVGRAIYAAHGPERTYSLVCFSHDLPPERRSDRVIATEWDATFTLFDGVPDAADLERLARNVPKQEAGRVSCREISLSRANKSGRVFDHVVDSLARGRQPDPAQLTAVGYLMRTTAVYGSGKFGAADRERIAGRPEFAAPFQAEMLSVWLTRAFTVDLAEYLARARAPEAAVRLDPALRRRLGVGNSTGLGLAPFIINHPALLHRWVRAREEALARVRAIEAADEPSRAAFRAVLERARLGVAEWRTGGARQAGRVATLAVDLERLAAHAGGQALDRHEPWDALYLWAERHLSLEGQEMVVTLLIEPHGELVDDLADQMAADEEAFRIDGGMRIGALRRLLEQSYAWALAVDFEQAEAQARFWYTSAEKLEPRIGERLREAGDALELPLATGRDAARLHATLAAEDDEALVADVLIGHPEHRHIVRRAQLMRRCPYAEIRDNLIGARMLPIDLLRCKLSFFGATKFDPRSDRWVRINMFQDAPYPDELDRCAPDDWAYPPLSAASPGDPP